MTTQTATPLEQTHPHYSTNWRAEYQIKHHIAFGELAAAVSVLRRLGVSCRSTDYDGELARHISTTVHRNDVIRDGDSIALVARN